jgi:SET domain-containing protein
MIKIQKSRNGKGVFATEVIPTGTLVQIFQGQRFSSSEVSLYKEVALHCMQIGEDLFLSPSGGTDDFFNHSCEPNTGFLFKNEVPVLFSIKEILPGEEIVWDYATMTNNLGVNLFPEWIEECFCGNVSCRKVIKSFDSLPRQIQVKYKKLGIVPQYVL